VHKAASTVTRSCSPWLGQGTTPATPVCRMCASMPDFSYTKPISSSTGFSISRICREQHRRLMDSRQQQHGRVATPTACTAEPMSCSVAQHCRCLQLAKVSVVPQATMS